MTEQNGPLTVLEARTPVVFFVAGVLMVAFAVNTYLKTFVGTSYPVIQNAVAPFGFLVGVVGLFGLYPAIADPAPRLARVAGAVATITTAGWVIILLNSIGRLAGVLSEPEGPLAMAPIVVIVSMILAFALFGTTSLYTGAHSRLVGGLLLVESTMFLVLLARVAPYLLLIDIGHIVAYLGLAITLRATAVTADGTDRASDSAL